VVGSTKTGFWVDGSWSEYAEAELKPSEGLAADVRRQLVGMLSAQGMSTRAIAPVVGVTFQQVAKVQTQVSHEATPEAESPVDRVLADAETRPGSPPGG